MTQTASRGKPDGHSQVMFSSSKPSATLLEFLRHRQGHGFPRAKRVWGLARAWTGRFAL